MFPVSHLGAAVPATASARVGVALLGALADGGVVPLGAAADGVPYGVLGVVGVVPLEVVADAGVAFLGTLEDIVKEATGWPGLVIVWAYSFLIAFILPGPSEVVLLAPLDLGLPYWATLALIMVVSGVGKACGSVLAFHIGQEAKESGPVIRWLRRSRFDVVEWSERTAVEMAQRWGYVGLALALSVPFFPDTISIYAFAVLEEDYVRFAAASFAGSIGRLVVTVFVVGGVAITV